MAESMHRPTVLTLSVLLGIVIFLTSLGGLMKPDFYEAEALTWQVQSIGQDMINMFIVIPFLFISAFHVYKGNLNAILLWAGSILYILYTYVIYCFNIHFNVFFLQYCFILGLSVYILLYILYSNSNLYPTKKGNEWISKITALYFLLLSLLFCFLWLYEIIPAMITHSIPKNVSDAGLFTNPVHVLDLSVLLPGIFITGILLLKKNGLGYFLAPVILTFFILMDITIALLTLFMINKGVSQDISVVCIMSGLALVSVILLSLNLKKQ